MSCCPVIKTINRVERTVFIQTCPYLRLYDLWHLLVQKRCLIESVYVTGVFLSLAVKILIGHLQLDWQPPKPHCSLRSLVTW